MLHFRKADIAFTTQIITQRSTATRSGRFWNVAKRENTVFLTLFFEHFLPRYQPWSSGRSLSSVGSSMRVISAKGILPTPSTKWSFPPCVREVMIKWLENRKHCLTASLSRSRPKQRKKKERFTLHLDTLYSVWIYFLTYNYLDLTDFYRFYDRQAKFAQVFLASQTFDWHPAKCHILPRSFFQWPNSCECFQFHWPEVVQRSKHLP